LQHVNSPYPGASRGNEILIDPTIDLEPKAMQLAESISWQLAFHEALWSLIHSGVLLVSDHSAEGTAYRVDLVCKERGGSSGINLGDFEMSFPRGKIQRSRIADKTQTLCNADLYLGKLDIPGLQKPVEEALREAVRCFRQELFIAAAVMIGRAAEGALLELGESLGATFSEEPGLVEIIRRALKALESNQAKPILKKSAVRLEEGRDVIAWAYTVRDARNSIHYTADPLENGYERVGVLLLGVVANLRIIYRIVGAANSNLTNP